MAEGEILFMCNDKSNSDKDGGSTTAEEEMWDDTALVQAYDHAVSLAKEEVERRMGLHKGSVSENDSNISNKPKVRKRRNKKEWCVGDPCRAVYSEDGVSYEATINSVFQEKSSCIITYVGYNNVEEVPLTMLEPSKGAAARKAQELAAAQESVNMEQSDGESVKEGAYFQHRPSSAQANKMNWGPRSARQNEFRFMPHNFGSFRMPSMNMPPMVVPPPPPPHLTHSSPEEDVEALSAMLMSWYMSGFHTGYYQGLKQAKNLASRGGSFSRNSSRKK